MSALAEVNNSAEIKDSFESFYDKAKSLMDIRTEQHYEEALLLIEEIMLNEEESSSSFALVDLLAASVKKYENKQQDVIDFDKATKNIPQDIAVLRTLMEQYKLTCNDLPEIGTKSAVSMILNGYRKLTRKHIEQLSQRFSITPSLFFE